RVRGEDISLGARIVAVADAYEVITAPRPYKRPIKAEAARQELTRCAGTDFDPAVVRAFLNISIGRIRLVMGPLSWLAQLPFLGSIPQLEGNVLVASRQAATLAGTATGVGAMAVGGIIHPLPAAPRPTPATITLVERASQTSPEPVDEPTTVTTAAPDRSFTAATAAAVPEAHPPAAAAEPTAPTPTAPTTVENRPAAPTHETSTAPAPEPEPITPATPATVRAPAPAPPVQRPKSDPAPATTTTTTSVTEPT